MDLRPFLYRPLFLSSLGVGILAFAVPVMGHALGATAAEIGGLYSVFALATLVLRPVVGFGLDRFGQKPFLVVGCVCYALAMASFALVTTLPFLYLGRVLQGVGSAVLWLSAYKVATDGTTTDQRGGILGQVEAAGERGALSGALVGFIVLSVLPLLLGWRLLFGSYAVLAVGGAWLAWRYTPHQKLVSSSKPKERWRPSGSLLRLMAVVFVTGAASATLWPLLLISAQNRFTSSVGLLATAYLPAALVASFLSPVLGRLSDRVGRAPLMALGLAGSGLLALLIPALPNLLWLAVLWALEAVGLAMAVPAEIALVADLTGGEQRGAGYGFYTFAASLGAVCGPVLGGWLYDTQSHALPFYVFSGLLLAGAVAVVILFRGLNGAERSERWASRARFFFSTRFPKCSGNCQK
jgi:MFS transporter, DHA1 family, multidrug resistance protein